MKTFQGIITNWGKMPVSGDHYRIIGTCLKHEDKPANSPALQALRDTIQEGEPIFTSQVVTMTDMEGFTICETKNSRYILIGPAK